MISRLNRRRLVKLARVRVSKIHRLTNAWDGIDDENGSNGASSSFIRITENWGFKFKRYSSLSCVLAMFKRQRKAWRIGVGPFCFGLIRFTINGSEYFGFITEVVKPMTIGNKNATCVEYMPQHVKSLNRLVNRLKKKVGFNFYDTHTGNIAYRGSNKAMLCIDFD